jgi:hypothetical protein
MKYQNRTNRIDQLGTRLSTLAAEVHPCFGMSPALAVSAMTARDEHLLSMAEHVVDSMESTGTCIPSPESDVRKETGFDEADLRMKSDLAHLLIYAADLLRDKTELGTDRFVRYMEEEDALADENTCGLDCTLWDFKAWQDVQSRKECSAAAAEKLTTVQ